MVACIMSSRFPLYCFEQLPRRKHKPYRCLAVELLQFVMLMNQLTAAVRGTYLDITDLISKSDIFPNPNDG